jgi:hypothetical protein
MDNSKTTWITVVRNRDDQQLDPAVVLAHMQQLVHSVRCAPTSKAASVPR